MDTRRLEAVIAVARHGSFATAARQLHVDPSTLSRQVSALERELGAALFVRGPSEVSPTEEGRTFLPEAIQIVDAVHRAKTAVRSRRALLAS